MSCITEIIKRKGDQEYLVTPNHAIETGGVYKDYEYIVTVTARGHRCGYVAIPSSHKLHGLDLTLHSEPEPYNLNVHGGITWSQPGSHIIRHVLGEHHCDDMWIGFDAAHYQDGKDIRLVRRLWKDNPEVMRETDAMEAAEKRVQQQLCGYDCHGDEIIRTNEYMVQECINLIDQIVEGDKAA